MRIKIADDKRLLISCTDKKLLEDMQARMDGSKVYRLNQILIPFKSGPKIFRYSKYGIEWGEGVKELVMNIIKNIKTRKATIIKCRNDYKKPNNFNYDYKGVYDKILDHQVVMYNIMTNCNIAAILADPGTCKTGPYLWAIDKKIQQGKVKRALIVTLSPLKKNILAEAKIQIPHLKCVILNKKVQSNNILNKTYKIKSKNIDYDIYIANYESMFSVVEMINDKYFDLVILDEAHRIGSPRSRQTKSIIKQFENSRFKYIVTGTLHANNMMSFYMPFRFMGPDTVPYAKFDEFRRQTMRTVDPDGYIWVPNPGSEMLVQKIIGNASVAFKKEECLDLPPIIYQRYECDMAPGQAKLYNEMKDDLVGIVKNMCDHCNKKENCDRSCEDELIAKNALVLAGKLRQIACGFYMNTRIKVDNEGRKKNDTNIITLNENPKIKLLIQVLNNIPSNRKVIIWSSYIHSIDLLSKAFTFAFGANKFLTCYKTQDAFDQVEKFKNPNIPYMIANPSKMGVGLNIHFSNYQIYFNNSYSWRERDQSESRQHRKGQKEKVTIIDLILSKTIDEIILKALILKEDLSISLSQLARVLQKGPKEMDKILTKQK